MSLRLATFLSPNYEALYRRIAAQIEQKLAGPVEFVVGESFEQFMTEPFDLVLACGFWYVQNATRYLPLAAPVLAGERYQGQPVYYCDLVVGPANLARRLTDLKGQTFIFNEPHSFSGYWALADALGGPAELGAFFGRLAQSGAHLTSLRRVSQETTACALLDSTVLDYELARDNRQAATLRVIASFGPYPVPPLLVNQALAPATRELIAESVLSLAAEPELLSSFGITEYRRVGAADYVRLAALYRQRSDRKGEI